MTDNLKTEHAIEVTINASILIDTDGDDPLTAKQINAAMDDCAIKFFNDAISFGSGSLTGELRDVSNPNIRRYSRSKGDYLKNYPVPEGVDVESPNQIVKIYNAVLNDDFTWVSSHATKESAYKAIEDYISQCVEDGELDPTDVPKHDINDWSEAFEYVGQGSLSWAEIHESELEGVIQ